MILQAVGAGGALADLLLIVDHVGALAGPGALQQ